jgi:hypothetical protein
VGVDVHAPENHCQFVHQRDVHIPLGIFNHLGGFGRANRAGLES